MEIVSQLPRRSSPRFYASRRFAGIRRNSSSQASISFAMNNKVMQQRRNSSFSYFTRTDYVLIMLLTIAVNIVIFVNFRSCKVIEYHSSSTESSAEKVPNVGNMGEYPEVFIYRRSKKTGSSSMLEQLLNVSKAYGYRRIYSHDASQAESVRGLCRFEKGALRVMILNHNSITRRETYARKVVIADTIRDGFEQITSLCRFWLQVKDCGEEMKRCFKDGRVLEQMRYRWGGDREESEDSYIDLPLSSKHPALSSSVLRRVFDNVTLNIGRYNVVQSRCEENADLKEVYRQYYGELDQQVDKLRARILALTGYPSVVYGNRRASMRLLLDRAEEMEREKYQFEENTTGEKRGYAKAHDELRQSQQYWWVEKGELKVENFGNIRKMGRSSSTSK